MLHDFRNGANDALVKTDKGFVKGYYYDGINIFKGIPYAKAERFHSPMETDKWEGVKNTAIYGAICPNFGDSVPMDDLSTPHRYWPASEDCMNLNVWTPGLDNKKRPVIVWFHGGGFVNGSSVEHVSYDGANMAKYGDVVVVTINHRLNVVGYLDCSSFGEEYKNSGNAGNEDILYSLKWVNRNIEAFGGDKENVTIVGQSGGGMKVTCMLQCPEADGLYHKAIVMSGVMDGKMGGDIEGNPELVTKIMAELKLKTIRELEKVPYKDLVTAYNKVAPELRKLGKYAGCNPIKNYFYAGNPLTCGFRKETAKIPTIISSVYNEFGGMMPLPIVHNVTKDEQVMAVLNNMFGNEKTEKLVTLFKAAYPERKLTDLIFLDFVFRASSITYSLERAKNNDHVYNALFAKDSAVSGGSLPAHCSDIPYLFHNCELVPSTQSGNTEQLEKDIFESVMSFARTGDPNHKGMICWPNVTDKCATFIFGEKNYIAIDHDAKIASSLQEAMMPVLMKMFAQMQ